VEVLPQGENRLARGRILVGLIAHREAPSPAPGRWIVSHDRLVVELIAIALTIGDEETAEVVHVHVRDRGEEFSFRLPQSVLAEIVWQ
jgi:hypothetical protein